MHLQVDAARAADHRVVVARAAAVGVEDGTDTVAAEEVLVEQQAPAQERRLLRLREHATGRAGDPGGRDRIVRLHEAGGQQAAEDEQSADPHQRVPRKRSTAVRSSAGRVL